MWKFEPCSSWGRKSNVSSEIGHFTDGIRTEEGTPGLADATSSSLFEFRCWPTITCDCNERCIYNQQS